LNRSIRFHHRKVVFWQVRGFARILGRIRFYIVFC
ncbi:hypothetical protein ECNE037_3552, partial [Escherichia coli NE037]